MNIIKYIDKSHNIFFRFYLVAAKLSGKNIFEYTQKIDLARLVKEGLLKED